MEEKGKTPFFIKSTAYEIITVLIIILTVLSIKFISPKLFSEIEKYYSKNVTDNCLDTVISENGNEI